MGTEERGGDSQDSGAAGLRDPSGPSISEAPQAQLRQDTGLGSCCPQQIPTGWESTSSPPTGTHSHAPACTRGQQFPLHGRPRLAPAALPHHSAHLRGLPPTRAVARLHRAVTARWPAARTEARPAQSLSYWALGPASGPQKRSGVACSTGRLRRTAGRQDGQGHVPTGARHSHGCPCRWLPPGLHWS